MTRRTLVRRAITIASLLAATAVDSDAFKVDIHADVTREALARFAQEALSRLANSVPTEKRELFRLGFSQDAIEEVVNGNKAMDTGDCAWAADPLRPTRRPDNIPASPCTTLGSETIAALEYLSEEPPEEHFDREKIQEGSDRIFNVTADIRAHLKSRRFADARKALGGVLHSIQDFYAHTNWVELGNQGFERRLGSKIGSFLERRIPGDRGTPRIAEANEPTCRAGDRLFTDLTPGEQEALLESKIDGARILKRMQGDPPLTSGYFFMWPLLFATPLSDEPEVASSNKCRHGYKPVDATYEQPGINKDDPSRRGHDNARLLAWGHSVNYIVSLFNDSNLRSQPNFVDLMLGFMGYEPRITSFDISQVPGPPPRQMMWDDLFDVFSIFRLHPDIEACVSVGTERICAEECTDTEVANPATPCRKPFGSKGLWLPASGSIGVEVWDNDPTSRQLMARGEIPVSDACLANIPGRPQTPCKIETPSGPLVIQFDMGNMPATADSASPSPPPAPGSPAERASPPPPGSPTERALPTPPANPAGRALTPPPARTPEAIDAALRLRDADQCIGADTFFPSGDALAGSAVGRRLGPEQTNRLYQAAALWTVIGDPAAKQNLMAAIQPRVDSGDWLDVMTSLLMNPQQAQAIVVASQGTAKHFAGQVAATGLDQLLQPARPVAAIEPDVNRWIAKRLASVPLAAEAVDRIFAGPQTISAECTLNQLAKDGFTDTVNGR